MTFDELLEEIYLITGRRDLEAESKSGIKRATLKAHQSDFYQRDIWEEVIQLPTCDYIHSLDPYQLWPNFRKWKYFKRVDSNFGMETVVGNCDTTTGVSPFTTGSTNDSNYSFLEIIHPEEILDSYGCNRSDIAYEAGRILEIRSAVTFNKAVVGIYVTPIVTEANYSSWVAAAHPWFIIHEACRLVFRSIGKLDEANAQGQFAAEELAELKLTQLSTTGY